MKKLVVDENSCIGCGACISLDEKHFSFSDDGLSMAISNDDLESSELKSAIECCPTNAIKIEESKCSCDSNSEHCDCENCDCEH